MSDSQFKAFIEEFRKWREDITRRFSWVERMVYGMVGGSALLVGLHQMGLVTFAR